MHSIVRLIPGLFLIILVPTLIDSYPFKDDRIVGGQNTTIERFPYQISFRNQGRHICGGSVIKLNVIITAAHCLQGVEAIGDISVVAGATNKDGYDGLIRNVLTVLIHPNYSDDPTNFDVALLILDRALYFSEKIQPVYLPPSHAELFPAGVKAFVSGWGRLASGGETPNDLNYVAVYVVSNADCEKAYGVGRILPEMICAGYDGGGRDSCQGDSGGPLVVENFLIGIVSWGRGCAMRGYPGVYARVSVLRGWIENELQKIDID